MTMSGSYVLDLFCDFPGCPLGEEPDGGWHSESMEDQDRQQVEAQARRDGWTLNKDKTCFCPSHADIEQYLERESSE